MSAVEYSENDIEYVVKSFKNYLRKVVKHSAIDYVRKVNNRSVKENCFLLILWIKMCRYHYMIATFFLFLMK